LTNELEGVKDFVREQNPVYESVLIGENPKLQKKLSKSERNRNKKLERAQNKGKKDNQKSGKNQGKKSKNGAKNNDFEVSELQSEENVKNFIFGNNDKLFNDIINQDTKRSHILQNYSKSMNKSMTEHDIKMNLKKRQHKFESRNEFSHFLCTPLWHLQNEKLVEFRVSLNLKPKILTQI
jgi:hypothetical protein